MATLPYVDTMVQKAIQSDEFHYLRFVVIEKKKKLCLRFEKSGFDIQLDGDSIIYDGEKWDTSYDTKCLFDTKFGKLAKRIDTIENIGSVFACLSTISVGLFISLVTDFAVTKEENDINSKVSEYKESLPDWNQKAIEAPDAIELNHALLEAERNKASEWRYKQTLLTK